MLLERILQNLTGLVETQIELIKLEAKEEITFAVVRMLYAVTVILVLAVFLIAFSLGVAMLLNDWLESRFWGFFIIAFLFGAKAGILLYYRKDKRLFNCIKRYAEEILIK